MYVYNMWKFDKNCRPCYPGLKGLLFHWTSQKSRQVVIEKEEAEGELKREVDALRKLLETQKGLQHTQDMGC